MRSFPLEIAIILKQIRAAKVLQLRRMKITTYTGGRAHASSKNLLHSNYQKYPNWPFPKVWYAFPFPSEVLAHGA